MFNSERTISATLKGICGQTHRRLDIVVVDDGSTDGPQWPRPGRREIRACTCCASSMPASPPHATRGRPRPPTTCGRRPRSNTSSRRCRPTGRARGWSIAGTPRSRGKTTFVPSHAGRRTRGALVPGPGGPLTTCELNRSVHTACSLSAKDLPPKTTVYDYFSLWRSDRTLLRLHQALYAQVREAAGRSSEPTVAILDSQSAKAAQKGAPRSTRKAMTPARRSRAASGISSSTRSACC